MLSSNDDSPPPLEIVKVVGCGGSIKQEIIKPSIINNNNTSKNNKNKNNHNHDDIIEDNIDSSRRIRAAQMLLFSNCKRVESSSTSSSYQAATKTTSLLSIPNYSESLFLPKKFNDNVKLLQKNKQLQRVPPEELPYIKGKKINKKHAPIIEEVQEAMRGNYSRVKPIPGLLECIENDPNSNNLMSDPDFSQFINLLAQGKALIAKNKFGHRTDFLACIQRLAWSLRGGANTTTITTTSTTKIIKNNNYNNDNLEKKKINSNVINDDYENKNEQSLSNKELEIVKRVRSNPLLAAALQNIDVRKIMSSLREGTCVPRELLQPKPEVCDMIELIIQAGILQRL